MENVPKSPLSAPKRGRGRPKGCGKLPNPASLGKPCKSEQKEDSNYGILGEMPTEMDAFSNMTPYILMVDTGEDIGEKLLEFGKYVRGIYFVMSAVGPVRTADICSPDFHRYEGYFEIMLLSASRTLERDAENGCREVSFLHIKLLENEHKLFGGKVSGPIIAAGPVQIILGAYKNVEERKRKTLRNSVDRSVLCHRDSDELKDQHRSEVETTIGEMLGVDEQTPDEFGVQGEAPDNKENLVKPTKVSPLLDDVISVEPISNACLDPCSEGEPNISDVHIKNHEISSYLSCPSASQPSELPGKD